MREVTIDEKYRVIIDGTSDGTQDKYFKDGIWYKTDRYGGEGHNEALVSKLLSCTNIDNYVEYEEVIINGHKGCCSSNFLNKNEEYISIYRLHANSVGGDIAKKLMYMDYDDQVDYVRNFVKNETGLNADEFLADLFWLDGVILNDDRHFNNIGFIFDGNSFTPAPIFDNGKSFFCGNAKYNPVADMNDNIKKVRFRPFTANNPMMRKTFATQVTVDYERLNDILSHEENPIFKNVLDYTLNINS